MKFSSAILFSTIALAQGFSVNPSSKVPRTALEASRRDVLNGALTAAVGAAVFAPAPAFAGDYVPKVDDLKQIYFLGASLDRLVDKLGNPDTADAALEAVQLFNKDGSFYPGYAKNFILKIVKKGADQDPRVGYIKQACTLIGSVEQVAAGGAALMDKAATAEAINRVKKAQALIGKFLAESGVKDEKIDAYIAAHK